jgi:hypothetical protein
MIILNEQYCLLEVVAMIVLISQEFTQAGSLGPLLFYLPLPAFLTATSNENSGFVSCGKISVAA